MSTTFSRRRSQASRSEPLRGGHVIGGSAMNLVQYLRSHQCLQQSKEHERQALMYEMLGRLMFCTCVSDSCAVGLRMLRGSRGLGEQRQREEHAHWLMIHASQQSKCRDSRSWWLADHTTHGGSPNAATSHKPPLAATSHNIAVFETIVKDLSPAASEKESISREPIRPSWVLRRFVGFLWVLTLTIWDLMSLTFFFCMKWNSCVGERALGFCSVCSYDSCACGPYVRAMFCDGSSSCCASLCFVY